MIPEIKEFCNKTNIYPPVILFGGINNPTAQEKKAEQRIINICEDLYKIDNPTLRNLRSAYQEANLSELFQKNIKDPYMIEKCAILATHLKHTHKKLEMMHKKDPILSGYFSDWSLSKTDIDLVWKYVIDNLKETDIMEASKLFKEICIKTDNELKGEKK